MQSNTILEKFCTNINTLVKKEKTILIGREFETRKVIQSLNRIKKNNVLIIGDAGVGKTILVYGLAIAINTNNVPECLKNKQIYSLNLDSLLAGTKMRGELEERIEKLFQELKSLKNIILFIDELHTVIKKQLEGIDISNILKTYLTQNIFSIIGATTVTEYQKYIEPEKAFKRRFNQVYLSEPSVDETATIIRGIKENLEIFYGIGIQDKAITTAIHMSNKYFIDLKNPDKTIDIIDETSSRLSFNTQLEPQEIYLIKDNIDKIKLEIESKKIDLNNEKETNKDLSLLNSNINQLEEQIIELEKEYIDKKNIWLKEKHNTDEIQKLKKEIDLLETKAFSLQKEGKFTEAGKIYYVDLQNIKNKIENIETNTTSTYVKRYMTMEDVLVTVSEKTGIPIYNLKYDVSNLKNFIEYLKKEIIGQNNGIEQIGKQLQISFSAFRETNKPIASIFITGPTGVGKTETAKQICYFLFGKNSKLNIINMSQYKEKHSLSSLIGAPPGYVGYSEEGILTGIPRKRPYQVILLDEIEKAHPSICDMLLPILDTGQITDQRGYVANFSESIIIMTSNALVEKEVSQKNLYKKLSHFFKREFLNRIDLIVSYEKISSEVFQEIIKKQVNFFIDQFYQNKGIKIIVENCVIQYIVRSSFDKEYGARETQRQIYNILIYPLINKIISYQEKEENTKISSIYVSIATGILEIKLFP